MSEIKRYRHSGVGALGPRELFDGVGNTAPEGSYVSAADFDRVVQERDTLARRVAWQPIEQLEQRGRLFAFNANHGLDGMVTWWPGGGFNGEGCWCWDGETIAWSRQRGNQPTHGIVPPAPPVRDEEVERP